MIHRNVDIVSNVSQKARTSKLIHEVMKVPNNESFVNEHFSIKPRPNVVRRTREKRDYVVYYKPTRVAILI